ncbi:TetR/AcrR family transcriptional regulator [Umezawaea sp. Da 62-37]|uniref:TetR/AcrR family transcriptional regulator n=1 Tax=Umezawaea sp. Da 62-37 TaxID=3075927 RepID=UPI0028F6D35A|nr:TetR/AcrR family transcriptional regulator [Umezawaea sp. Da 62-37]WNV87257.1 TetR/AcrR family transcriptional regulator [Umezawaea sp. Da 62-37]
MSGERELTAKGLATRERIVEYAAAVTRERGAANTRMECVRVAANVSNSQLFHYFPQGKAEMMVAVARYEARTILADQESRLRATRTWRAWDEWSEALYAHYEENGTRCGLAALLGQLDQDAPEVRDVLAGLLEAWERVVADGIRAMQSARKIDPGLDADTMAGTIVTGVIGGIVMMTVTGSTSRLRTTLRASIATLRGAARQ